MNCVSPSPYIFLWKHQNHLETETNLTAIFVSFKFHLEGNAIRETSREDPREIPDKNEGSSPASISRKHAYFGVPSCEAKSVRTRHVIRSGRTNRVRRCESSTSDRINRMEEKIRTKWTKWRHYTELEHTTCLAKESWSMSVSRFVT